MSHELTTIQSRDELTPVIVQLEHEQRGDGLVKG